MPVYDDLFGDGKVKKRGINSSRKGKVNERKIAKALSVWTGCEFNRTPQSGGLRWADSDRVAGDLVAPASLFFPFIVETKHLSNLHVSADLRKNSIIFRIMHQTVRDCLRLGEMDDIGLGAYFKAPMIILKANRGHIFMFVPQFLHRYMIRAGVKEVSSGVYSSNADLLFNDKKILIKEKIYGYLFDDVVKHADYGVIAARMKQDNNLWRLI